MSFASYSLTPSANTTIAGQSVAEGTTAPGTVNLAIRQVMADGREIYNLVKAIDLSGYADLLTSPPKRIAIVNAIITRSRSANRKGGGSES